MKVILLEDVKSLGKKGQIVDINDGYARNFVLPKKLGVEANGRNMNELKLQKANAEKVARQQLEEAKALSELMSTKSVTLTMKAGDNGKCFGSISSKEIAQAASEQCDLTIDKKKIQLPETIKTFGVFDVAVKLHPQVTGTLKVNVVEG